MIHARYYGIVFLYVVVILSIIVASNLNNKSFNTIKKGENNTLFTFVLCSILAIWLGLRPDTNSYNYFGDSFVYAYSYSLMKDGLSGSYMSSNEWIWSTFSVWCSKIMDVKYYFTLISIGYFSFTFIACRILTKNNVLVSFLFLLGSFSFYAYGVNGLRNGLACSIVLVIIALLISSKRNLILCLVLSFVAINIHRSTMLPITCLVTSVYLVKNFKWALRFWLASIAISLIAGGAVTSLFTSLGFDDRVSYLSTSDNYKFSHTGFRWDFLLYSMMPIAFGYYLVIKRGLKNQIYSLLLNTYTLSNAFWVMLIRANFSNRFAYLSWFMYPLVLAYPLLKMNIWGEQQGRLASRIMLAHIGFTWFMATFYW